MTSLAILVILIGFIFFALYRTGIHRFKFLNFSAGSLISKTKLTVRRYYNKFILRNLNKEEISLSDLEEGLMNLYKNQDVQSQEGSLLPPVAIISQHDEDNDSVNFKSISFGNEERPGRIRTRSSVLSFSDLDNMRDYTSKKLANGVTMGISTSNNSSPNLGGPETNNNAKLTRSFTHTNINQYQQHQHQQPSWYGIGVNHGGIVINGNSNEAGSDKKNLRRTVSTNVLKSNNNISTNKDN
ncbi:hypothetical protein PACTADRAFT_33256 [Pachysolen tannophilus NRRL Y-2460]|uniref:Uncharacterized protein n=1 Tax=Pachysolen tannophilus NRRL Y-2460 TaxID=669874 RepID=A0A1E4TWL9_PACTA|nr:hypothetical protein PACTADRAFT_33256 [Pachysolen tannophilus NRRL Y-2460]